MANYCEPIKTYKGMLSTKPMAWGFLFLTLLLACNNQPPNKPNPKNDNQTTECDCKKIKDSADIFYAAQKARWENVKKMMKNDSAGLYKALFGFEENAIAADLTTDKIAQMAAQYFIGEYMRHTAENMMRNGPAGQVNIKRTNSVWIKKDAILSFANTLINDKSIDGIRLYFAQYPLNGSELDSKLNKSVNGMKTIIFTATTPTADGNNHVDYFPSQADGRGLYIYDYNSLCPDKCIGAVLGQN